MLINTEQLIGLKVETESGDYVGRVQSFDLDVDAQCARTYHIKRSLLEGGMFSEELMVHHKQIVAITSEKMIVSDNVVKYKEREEKKIFVGTQVEV